MKIGASTSVKPRASKKSRIAFSTVWRTRRITCWRWRAEPQVPLLHQERDAVLLVADRVLAGRPRDDREVADVELEADGRALVLLHEPGDGEARLLRQVVRLDEDLGRHVALEDHALDRPRAVADLQEVELPRRAAVVSQPWSVTSFPSWRAMSATWTGGNMRALPGAGAVMAADYSRERHGGARLAPDAPDHARWSLAVCSARARTGTWRPARRRPGTSPPRRRRCPGPGSSPRSWSPGNRRPRRSRRTSRPRTRRRA